MIDELQVGELAGIAVGATVMLNILIAGYVTVYVYSNVPKKGTTKITTYLFQNPSYKKWYNTTQCIVKVSFSFTKLFCVYTYL